MGVLIGYRTDRDAAEAVAADCPGSAILAADLTESDAVDRLFDQTLQVAGCIDGLFKCAGPQTLVPFAALEERDWASMKAAHVNAPARLIRRLVAHATEEGTRRRLSTSRRSKLTGPRPPMPIMR